MVKIVCQITYRPFMGRNRTGTDVLGLGNTFSK